MFGSKFSPGLFALQIAGALLVGIVFGHIFIDYLEAGEHVRTTTRCHHCTQTTVIQFPQKTTIPSLPGEATSEVITASLAINIREEPAGRYAYYGVMTCPNGQVFDYGLLMSGPEYIEMKIVVDLKNRAWHWDNGDSDFDIMSLREFPCLYRLPGEESPRTYDAEGAAKTARKYFKNN